MRNLTIALVAAATAALGVGYFLSLSPSYGGQNYEYGPKVFASTVKIGVSGSPQTFFTKGTCNLSQSSPGSHAASSSKEYFCAVTGVQAGDTVLVSLPPGAGAYTSGASSLYGGFLVNSAFASTSNRIGVELFNGSGAATSSFSQATTSAHYTVYR